LTMLAEMIKVSWQKLLPGSGRIGKGGERLRLCLELCDNPYLDLKTFGWNDQNVSLVCEWPWEAAMEVAGAPAKIEVDGVPFHVNGRYSNRRQIGDAWYWDKETVMPRSARYTLQRQKRSSVGGGLSLGSSAVMKYEDASSEDVYTIWVEYAAEVDGETKRLLAPRDPQGRLINELEEEDLETTTFDLAIVDGTRGSCSSPGEAFVYNAKTNQVDFLRKGLHVMPAGQSQPEFVAWFIQTFCMGMPTMETPRPIFKEENQSYLAGASSTVSSVIGTPAAAVGQAASGVTRGTAQAMGMLHNLLPEYAGNESIIKQDDDMFRDCTKPCHSLT